MILNFVLVNYKKNNRYWKGAVDTNTMQQKLPLLRSRPGGVYPVTLAWPTTVLEYNISDSMLSNKASILL